MRTALLSLAALGLAGTALIVLARRANGSMVEHRLQAALNGARRTC